MLEEHIEAQLRDAREAFEAAKELERAMIADCVAAKASMPANYWHARHEAFKRVKALEGLLGK